MTTVLIVVVVLLLIAVAALGWVVYTRHRSERLKEQFGPEYDRRVAETGDRQAAEAELRERNQRRKNLDVRALRPEERTRFQDTWATIQPQFVDDPSRAVIDADRLILGIMRTRGYPVEDFDQRADDLSVDHADIVRHYREAHTVRDASVDGSADTEMQRRALTAYRALVDALLEHDDAEHDAWHDAAGHDGPGHDTAGRDPAGRDPAGHDAVRRDPTARSATPDSERRIPPGRSAG